MRNPAAFLMPIALLVSAPARPNGQGAPEAVSTKDAPATAGPYSQAVKAGGFVFAAGQVARDPATGKLIDGDVKVQTERVLKNLAAVLSAAGTDMKRVVKTTVFLKNAADFKAMNEVYARFFTGVLPARSTVQAAMPSDAALVEIDAVALQ
jgi:2-iminobutanoate/2-iminopropanoate deaminase